MSTDTTRVTWLEHHQINAISNCLSVAGNQFASHVGEFRQIAEALRAGQTVAMFASGEAGALAADRLANQFELQAEEARELWETLHDYEGMGFLGERYSDEEDDL